MLHGDTFRGENVAQLFWDTIDSIVEAASPIVRWATRKDFANIHNHIKRRRR